MDIPVYPEFRPLEFKDLVIFKEAFQKYPPQISEFTFTNLYSWRHAYQFCICRLHDFIIVSSESGTTKKIVQPIGSGDMKATIEKILSDLGGMCIRIPGETKALFDQEENIKATLDIDNSDYLYASADLINLAGGKYDGKRNLIKKFKSTHTYDYVRCDAANAPALLEFEETWCSIKDCDQVEGLDNERRAIREMIAHFAEFELIGGAIKVDTTIVAVAIAQRLNPVTLVMHVLKADSAMTGLYQLMLQEFLAREGEKFAYVNLEQDLGVEGLRKAKQSYHPLKLIHKYSLTLAI